MLNKFVDKTARKPSGWLGKKMYNDPHSHYTSFQYTLDKLQLKSDDIFLEIGCGGGVLLNMALEVVKYAKAIDHSYDMVQLAKEKNQDALSEGRVKIVQGRAESLPWEYNTFSCAAASNMFFFVEKPMTVLNELYRILKPGGRLVITSTEDSILPKILFFFWSHSMHLYKNSQMESMLRQIGFQTVEVKNVEKFIQLSYAIK